MRIAITAGNGPDFESRDDACSQDAIIVMRMDGVVLFWSPAAERMFGFPAHEMASDPSSP